MSSDVPVLGQRALPVLDVRQAVQQLKKVRKSRKVVLKINKLTYFLSQNVMANDLVGANYLFIHWLPLGNINGHCYTKKEKPTEDIPWGHLIEHSIVNPKRS